MTEPTTLLALTTNRCHLFHLKLDQSPGSILSALVLHSLYWSNPLQALMLRLHEHYLPSPSVLVVALIRHPL